jgi:hypothetical protein
MNVTAKSSCWVENWRFLEFKSKPIRYNWFGQITKPDNDSVHRAAANDTDFNKPRSPRLRVQHIVMFPLPEGSRFALGTIHLSEFNVTDNELVE